MHLSLPSQSRHTLGEDVQGIGVSVLLASVALAILTALGLMTGQTAGLAALLCYVYGWDFGWTFFLVNTPFYVLSLFRLGWRFTFKTFVAVGGLSLASHWMPSLFRIESMHPAFGAVVFGVLIGVALVAAFRHGASLGGMSILAVYLQDKTGFRAGWTQLIFDLVLFAVAGLVLDWSVLGYSLVGAAVMNLTIAINHRRDRYIAT